ncbi:MAG TPA: ferric reductase-like transmembrane domain-containing protein [Dehalococcoidia bacterium]|nr:ferric reductase-like transmembrane domain-containing protein [Dehalococcoidia bacterium]
MLPLALAAGGLALLPVPALAAGAGGDAAGVNVPWYLSRATGLVAYLLLFVTVALGLAIRTKAFDRLVARWRVTDLHGFLSLLAMLFVVVHVAALLGDTFIGFSAVQLLVPFASPYAAAWTAAGQIAAYLLLLLLLSFPARRLIGYRAWRALHYLTFLTYLGALAHGVFTGTDSRQLWTQALYLATAAVVALLLLHRIIVWNRRALGVLTARLRGVAPAEAEAARAALHLRAVLFGVSTLGAVFLLFLGAAVGPFRWLGGEHTAAGQATAPTFAAKAPAGFHDTFSGSVSTGRRATLLVRLDGTGERGVTLAMQVQPAAGGDGSTGYAGPASLSDGNGAPLCNGQVMQLDPNGFSIDCQGTGDYAGKLLRLRGVFTRSEGSQLWGTLDAVVGPAGE